MTVRPTINRIPSSYDAWKLASPPEPEIISGSATRTLFHGPHEEQEATIEFELGDMLEIISATLTATGEEIDPDDIAESDRDAFIYDILDRA